MDKMSHKQRGTLRLTAVLLSVLLLAVFLFSACREDPTDTISDEVSREVTTYKEDLPANRRTASARTGKNATNPFVIGITDTIERLNPFYPGTKRDEELIPLTHTGLINIDESGLIVSGVGENSFALSHSIRIDEDNSRTVFEFVLKKGLTFSDGTPMTAKDVLFSLYVYLDPSYSGPNTLANTDIEGLHEYRTQTPSKAILDKKEEEFSSLALQRTAAILDGTAPDEDIKAAWDILEVAVQKDFDYYVQRLSEGASLTDLGLGKNWPSDFPPTAAIFAYMGLIKMDGRRMVSQYEPLDINNLKDYSEEEVIDITLGYIKSAMTIPEYDLYTRNNVLTDGIDSAPYPDSGTALAFIEEYRNEYIDQNKGSIKNISGIQLDHIFGEDDLERERITITINGIAPDSIYAFAIPVSPMHYYSDEARASAFNGTDAFGVEFGSPDFQESIKKKTVPLGSGPYIASDSIGNPTKELSLFYQKGRLNFVANDGFFLAAPYIKYLRYQEISAGQEISSLKDGNIHFTEIPATKEAISKIPGTNLSVVFSRASAFGYVGINPELIPDIAARQALAHAFDPRLALEFFPEGAAVNISIPLSEASWAYPKNGQEKQYYDGTAQMSKTLFLESDSFIERSGKIRNSDGSTVRYTFVLPNGLTDHPMGPVFENAKTVLAKIGVEIEIITDTDLKSKISEGKVQVWAEDIKTPSYSDLYEVYYSDSKAQDPGATYRSLLHLGQSGTTQEIEAVEQLDSAILQGVLSLELSDKVAYYSDAFDALENLYIQIPIYQPNEVFAYNNSILDDETLYPDQLSLFSPVYRIWDVEMILK